MDLQGKNKNTRKNSFLTLDTKESCEKAIKAGWIAGIISCLITILSAVVIYPLFLMDAVFIGVLTFFIYKKSRVASTIMVVYFVMSKLIQLSIEADIIQTVTSVLFIYLYVQAMRATYIWFNKYKTSENAENQGFNP